MTDKKIMEILLRDGYHDAARRLSELIEENKRLAESVVPRKGGRKMDTREKLIEILCNSEFVADRDTYAEMADHLIANGVTVQQWIPVSERLPEESGMYIVTANDRHAQRVSFVQWQKKNRMWNLTGARSYWRVTHWMPLPEPPKGE